MKRNEKFEKSLEYFEKNVIEETGYFLKEGGHKSSSWSDDIYRYYSSNTLPLNIHIIFSEVDDGRSYIQFTMHSNEIGKYHQGKFFALSQYLKDHGILDFPSICQVGEDFEAFCDHYFEKLKVAFETYLKDQVTGVTFEEHDPFMGR